MFPWGLVLRIAGPLVAALAIFGWGYSAGGASVQRKADAALRESLMQARSRELQWQQDAATITEVHTDEVASLRSAHAAAVAGLRNRAASRLPETPAACAGASPAALSADDAAVALGIAADADKLRADYQACRSWAETLSAPFKTHNAP